MAASLGVLASKNGLKTIVVSTDPAHSLSDAFGQSLGTKEPTQIGNNELLFGQEIDANETMDEIGILFNQQDLGIFNQLFSEGESMADLSPPGTDEIVALMKLVDFIENPTSYDLVIFDTAPTGHTLNLLELPDVVDSWAFKMLSFQKKFKGIFSSFKGLFGGGSTQEAPDPLDSIERLREKIAIGKEKLTDETSTEFIPVTIPTMLSLWETDRLIRALIKNNINSKRIIINQINPENPNCVFCKNKNSIHMKVIDKISALFSDYEIYHSYMEEKEPQGLENLVNFAERVFTK